MPKPKPGQIYDHTDPYQNPRLMHEIFQKRFERLKKNAKIGDEDARIKLKRIYERQAQKSSDEGRDVKPEEIPLPIIIKHADGSIVLYTHDGQLLSLIYNKEQVGIMISSFHKEDDSYIEKKELKDTVYRNFIAGQLKFRNAIPYEEFQELWEKIVKFLYAMSDEKRPRPENINDMATGMAKFGINDKKVLKDGELPPGDYTIEDKSNIPIPEDEVPF